MRKILNESKGFTLIEILVVLLIISIIASVSLFSISNNSKVILKNESKRFVVLVQLAIEQALLKNETYGIHISASGYDFYEYSKNTWHPLNAKPFKKHTVDENISIQLYIDSIGVTLKSKNSENRTQPQLWISPSHEVSPFTVEFTNSDQNLITYTVDMAGKITAGNTVL